MQGLEEHLTQDLGSCTATRGPPGHGRRGSSEHRGAPAWGVGTGLEQTLIPGLAFLWGSFSSSWGNGSGLEADDNTWYRPPNTGLSTGAFPTGLSHGQPLRHAFPLT